MGNGYDDLLEVVYNHHPKDLSNSPTFVGFFVCGRMGRIINSKKSGNQLDAHILPIYTF